MNPTGIEVRGLSKRYGELVAVDDVQFAVAPGVLFGLLGPNGAGKSTTIGCISGLVAPSAGHVRVLGHDVASDAKAARAALGIVPQELALYEDLSARENVEYWGAAFGLGRSELRTRAGEVLELVGLSDRAKDPVKKLSGGMKRRLNFACGVVHRPRVLLLDEPTVGVDPQSRVRLLELVREEARAGVAVLYTTHYMEEAEDLCDELGVIDHGKIIARGTLAELRGLLGERDLVRLSGTFDRERTAQVLRGAEGLAGAELLQCDEHEVSLALAEASRRMPALFAALAAAGADVRETTLTQPSLESLFIKLTGKELRE